MSYRDEPRTLDERVAYIEELLRRIRVVQTARPAEVATAVHDHSAYVPHSLADAAGDLLIASGENVFTRLGVGSDGQVLTVDPTASIGVAWETLPSPHTHDGAGANSTIAGGTAEAAPGVPAASGAQSVAFGDYAQATNTGAVAVGAGTATTTSARASGAYAVAIGGGDGTNAGPNASGDDSTAIGYRAVASAQGAICVSASRFGGGSTASGVRSVCIGAEATASATDSVIIGTLNAVGSGGNGTVIIGGVNVQVAAPGSSNPSAAIAADANVGGSSATLLGHASGDSSVCVGFSGAASAASSTTIGAHSTASGSHAFAAGYNALASGTRSIAVGGHATQAATASATDAIAIGPEADATAEGALAAGRGAQATHADSVALGDGSVTTAADQLAIPSMHVEMTEISAPGNGAANSGRLYLADDGAGKTQLLIIFGSGAAQVLATEP